MWVPLSVVAFATLNVRLLPDASSIFHLLRNFVTSLFVSISVLTVSHTGRMNYAELGESITPFSYVLQFPHLMGRWTVDTVPGLAALAREINRQALMVGYTNAFLLYAIVSFAAIPFMLMVKIKE
jgi:DHA2 family multidrug resistance protein